MFAAGSSTQCAAVRNRSFWISGREHRHSGFQSSSYATIRPTHGYWLFTSGSPYWTLLAGAAITSALARIASRSESFDLKRPPLSRSCALLAQLAESSRARAGSRVSVGAVLLRVSPTRVHGDRAPDAEGVRGGACKRARGARGRGTRRSVDREHPGRERALRDHGEIRRGGCCARAARPE